MLRYRFTTAAILCLFLFGLLTPARAQKVDLGNGLVKVDAGDKIDFEDDPVRGDPRHVEAPSFGDRLDLSTPWLFHSGDSKGIDFAAAQFNDLSWQPINPHGSEWKNVFSKLNEIWYRVHVHLAPGTHDLALTVAEFGGSYRVYVNGLEIGGHGRMTGRGDYLLARSATFPIPDRALAADTVIAIHAYVGVVDSATFTLDDGLSQRSSVYLGPANVLYRDQKTYFANGLSENISALTLWAVLLALATALSFLIAGSRVYPVLAVYAGAHLAAILLVDWASFHYYPNTYWLVLVLTTALRLLSELALLEFLRILSVFGSRRVLIVFASFYVLATLSLALAAGGLIPFALSATLLKIAHIAYRVFVVLMVYLGGRRKQQDAYVLASVLSLYLGYYGLWWLLGRVDFFYQPFNVMARAFTANVLPGPMGDLAIVSAFLAVVLVRTLRIVRERATIANEIEAARTMQQLLLAQSNQPTPGFQVESAYLPAGEVGGDFFLVAPCAVQGEEPSLTVIVGDVSGKGMRAAMRVSMILGVLRREPSREPAAMLHGLNQALAEEHDSGFTTACCVRLSPDGRFTVANAGHISPYIAGMELITPPALPLGIAALEPGETYPLLAGRLLPGQRLVLMSDGVPEARTPKGELYGFDRLAPLTIRSAREIADTAQKFGQDDDITVVTIACLPRTTNTPPPPPVYSASAPPPMPVLPA